MVINWSTSAFILMGNVLCVAPIAALIRQRWGPTCTAVFIVASAVIVGVLSAEMIGPVVTTGGWS